MNLDEAFCHLQQSKNTMNYSTNWELFLVITLRIYLLDFTATVLYLVDVDYEFLILQEEAFCFWLTGFIAAAFRWKKASLCFPYHKRTDTATEKSVGKKHTRIISQTKHRTAAAEIKAFFFVFLSLRSFVPRWHEVFLFNWVSLDNDKIEWGTRRILWKTWHCSEPRFHAVRHCCLHQQRRYFRAYFYDAWNGWKLPSFRRLYCRRSLFLSRFLSSDQLPSSFLLREQSREKGSQMFPNWARRLTEEKPGK